MIIIIVLAALAGALAAFFLRLILARLSFLTWVGWLLVGTGLPVLAGQLSFLALAESPDEGAALAIPVLIAGLGGGLGWAACVVGLRLTRGQEG